MCSSLRAWRFFLCGPPLRPCHRCSSSPAGAKGYPGVGLEHAADMQGGRLLLHCGPACARIRCGAFMRIVTVEDSSGHRSGAISWCFAAWRRQNVVTSYWKRCCDFCENFAAVSLSLEILSSGDDRRVHCAHGAMCAADFDCTDS